MRTIHTYMEISKKMANKKMKMEMVDIISGLPDEILVSILSLLPAVESAVTTTLSKRWKPLWELVRQLTLNLTLNYRSPNLSPFNYLSKLILVNNSNIIDDQRIESALSKFPALQEFRLIGCYYVRNLTIRSNNLKKLEIIGCCNLRRLGLFALELASFKYNGPDIEYTLGDVPRLIEVSFVESYCYKVVMREFVQFKPILKQLTKIGFVLDFPWIGGCPLVIEFLGVNELRMDVRVWDTDNPSYLFGSLLESFPRAEVVSLRLFWPVNHEVVNLGIPKFEDLGRFHNVHVFELDGFIGNGLELEIFKMLVERAGLLEKVVVRVTRRASVESDVDLMDANERENAMIRAREDVIPILPRGTQLVLL